MQAIATVSSTPTAHTVTLRAGTKMQNLSVPGKASGKGFAVTGGEFLMLALATCYCNDLYREAERMNIPLDSVEVEASGVFAGVGLAASNIRYRATIKSPAHPETIQQLLRVTDGVAEVHNTIRGGGTVTMDV